MARPLGAALLIVLLASACATRKPAAPRPAPPPPSLPPTASVAVGAAAYRDQRRLGLPFSIEVGNPGPSPMKLESIECVLTVEGTEAGRLGLGPGTLIAGGGSASVPMDFQIDLRKLGEGISGSGGPATASWKIEARARLKASDGAALEALASAKGAFPIVREPIFRLTSVTIERDLLVTTNLRLGLRIDNPNAFPIEYRSLDYDFYGEGRLWSAAEDESDEAATVPAGGSAERALRFTMNFADMDRALFDLVAKLKAVRYRLAGQARVSTGLDALPDFVTRFDREGSCVVER